MFIKIFISRYLHDLKFPWRSASGTFGICICANELLICWAWLTHLPATALQQAGNEMTRWMVVGWWLRYDWWIKVCGQPTLILGQPEQLCHYAVLKQRKLIAVVVLLTSSSSKASYRVYSVEITPFTSLWSAAGGLHGCVYDSILIAHLEFQIAEFGRKIREMRGRDKDSPYLHSPHHECCDGNSHEK